MPSGSDRNKEVPFLNIDPSRSRASVRPNRSFKTSEWEEDTRYIEALDLIANGYKNQALDRLLCLFKDDPGHLYGRCELLRLAIDLGSEEVVRQHIEWAVGFYAQDKLSQQACDAYRFTRRRFPNLEWSEKSLIQVLVCAERASDHRVTIDCTNFLIICHPTSLAIPRALLASANVQHQQGRLDLALQSLRYVIARFPLDPLSELAKRRLRELGSETSTPR